MGKTEDYMRGQDVLDVWFDSGSSWAAVLGIYLFNPLLHSTAFRRTKDI